MGEQKSVLVTGASTGIGAGCAVGLARRGYRVFAGVRKPEDGARLRQILRRLPDRMRDSLMLKVLGVRS